MLKLVSVSLSLCLLAFSARAEELSPEKAIEAEFEKNKIKIDEIFQDKVQKISARITLPDDMRNLLISQADEIRQFDLETLRKKMDIKLKQAKKRDEMKESLRKDAQNRAKWMLEDEANFQRNKEEREEKETAFVKEVLAGINTTTEAKPAEEVKPVAEAKPAEEAKPVAEAKPAEEAKTVAEAKSEPKEMEDSELLRN